MIMAEMGFDHEDCCLRKPIPSWPTVDVLELPAIFLSPYSTPIILERGYPFLSPTPTHLGLLDSVYCPQMSCPRFPLSTSIPESVRHRSGVSLSIRLSLCPSLSYQGPSAYIRFCSRPVFLLDTPDWAVCYRIVQRCNASRLCLQHQPHQSITRNCRQAAVHAVC